MSKWKRGFKLLACVCVACAVTLVVGIPVGVAHSNSTKGLDGCQNTKITSKVVAYNNDGSEINPKDVDTSTYDGFMFRLSDDAPEELHAKQALKEFDGQIKYYRASDLYSADSLNTIDSFVDEKYIESIEPNYYMTLSDLDASSIVASKAADAASDAAASKEASAATKKVASTAANKTDHEAKENTSTPNDPKYTDGTQWNLTMMNVEGAWENDLYGQNIDSLETDDVTVAVIDSGLYGSGGTQQPHEDIDYDHVLDGVNLVDSVEGTPDTLSTMGHGTFVSGLIFAKMNNAIGISGITPEVNILPIRVFGTSSSTSTATVVEGIKQATAAGVDVINMSLGGEGTTQEMQDACEEAVDAGIMVVASAGNDGTSVNNYPAAYDCVVGVASLDQDGTTSYFSQYGDSVYVSAPGALVTSLNNEGTTSYTKASGTSFSSPEVAALAALTKSVLPETTQDDFKAMLQETSTDKGEEGFDKYYGWGLVNFKKASEYLLERAYCPTYHISFNIEDQDGVALDGVNIQVKAATDISWDDDEEAGIEAGTWEEGYVVEPDEDGSYSLHKGRYSYTLTKDSYYSKEGTFTTYSEYQKLNLTLEKTYQVNLNLIDSEQDKIDEATVQMTRVKDGLSKTIEQSESGTYQTLLPEGEYKYLVHAQGYEDASGYVSVGRNGLDTNVVLHTSGEVNYVTFEFRAAADEGETGELISDVSVVVKDGQGSIVPTVVDSDVYQLERGKRYSYTATRAGYEDEVGKFKVEQAATSTVTINMKASVHYAVFEAVDVNGDIIEDAEFEITDKDGNAIAPVKTNSSKFNLGNTETTTYNYIVNCAGYGSKKASFVMGRKDQYREFHIVLEAVTHVVLLNAKNSSDGATLSDATFAVYNKNGSLQTPASEGKWNLAQGTYTYVAYCNGYETKSASFEVASTDVNLDVALSAASSSSEDFSGGSGTVKDPYLVSTQAQLRSIAADSKYWDKSFRLLCDIELSSDTWAPIGTDSTPFSGTFDGAGHSVSNMTIDRSGKLYSGFFGAVKTARIENFVLSGEVKRAGQYSGGIVGCIQYESYSDDEDTASYITNCQFSGPVRGSSYVGGLVGYVEAGTSSRVNVYIENSAHTNGLVRAYSSDATYGDYVGGIVGSASATIISTCYNLGTEDDNNYGVTGNSYLGGIAGCLQRNAAVYNSYNSSYITHQGSASNACMGGVVGYLYGLAHNSYYLSQSDIKAGIGTKDGSSGAQATNIDSKTSSEMKANVSFTDTLNLLEDYSIDNFVTGDAFPVLYWQTSTSAKFSAEKPVFAKQPQAAQYNVGDSDVQALSATLNALSDNGTLTYQWYCNDSANTDGAQKLDGASGTVPENGVIECLPATDQISEDYYFVIVTNTYTDPNTGVVYKGSTRSDFAKVEVKSDTQAAAPDITSVGIVDASGQAAQNPLEGSYVLDEDVKDTIKVNASSTDGGTLAYQWYASKYEDTKGNPVKDATTDTLNIDTSSNGTWFYYVAVTNIKELDGGITDSVKVKTQRIKVIVLTEDEINSAAVVEKIDAIGNADDITLDKDNAVSEARAAYNALSDSAKELVTNYDALVQVEAKLDTLKQKTLTPSSVRSISVAANSYNSIKVSWNKDSNATGYEVYKSVAGATFKLVKTVNGANVISWEDTGLKTGKKYSYKVRAFVQTTLSTGVTNLYGSWSGVKAAKPALAKTTLTVKSGAKKATLRWKKVSGAKGYKIYRSTKKSKGYKRIKTFKKAKKVKFVNKKLKSGKRYYYKVRAYRVVDGKKVYSAYSKVKKVRVK